MTVTELRARVAQMPVPNNRFGLLDRILTWIDRELQAERGPDGEAPYAMWDDDGTLLFLEGDTLTLNFGGRLGGRWVAFVARPREPRAEVPVVEDEHLPEE